MNEAFQNKCDVSKAKARIERVYEASQNLLRGTSKMPGVPSKKIYRRTPQRKAGQKLPKGRYLDRLV